LNCWARTSTSGLAAVFVVCATAQSGRPPADAWPSVPGFVLDATGFRAGSSGADTFRFTESARGLRAVERNDKRHVFGLAGEVSHLLVSARSPGFEAAWRNRFALGLTGVAGPVLTVPGASFGPGAPTAPVPWVLVTPGPGQPAVMVVPLGGPAAFVVEGKPGDWTLRTEPPGPGAFRFCLPDGLRRIEGQTPAELGALVARVVPAAGHWSAPTPTLKSARLEQAPTGLKAVWTFDRPGAVVPMPLLLAREGGYGVRVLTDIVPGRADLPDGPVAFCRENRLAVEFPLDPVPPGRALFRGGVDWPEPPEDGASAAVWSALADLFANRPVDAIAASVARLGVLERAESLETVPADQLAAYCALDAALRRGTQVAGEWKLVAPGPVRPGVATGLAGFLALAEPGGLRFTGQAAGPSEVGVTVVSPVPLPTWPGPRVDLR
jgi:hypothetical protein